MTNIKLVTDSSVQLTDEEIAKYHITVVPLTVMIDNTIYTDGETISRSEFMAKMAEASALPKTSQPPIGRFHHPFCCRLSFRPSCPHPISHISHPYAHGA